MENTTQKIKSLSATAPHREQGCFELWHHYFTGTNVKTHKEACFFIDLMLFSSSVLPSILFADDYPTGLVYVGIWEEQLFFCGELFLEKDIFYSKKSFNLRLGNNICLENNLSGQIMQDKQHFLSRHGIGHVGSISYELTLKPELLCEQVLPPLAWPRFGTYHYASQLKTAYEGHIVVNEQEHIVKTSHGFKNKIWGNTWTLPKLKIYGGQSVSMQNQALKASGFFLLCWAPVSGFYTMGNICHIVFCLQGHVYRWHMFLSHKSNLEQECITFQNVQHKIQLEWQSPQRHFHTLLYPDLHNAFQSVLIAGPIDLKITFFSRKPLFLWKVMDEIVIKGACVERI